MTSITTWLRLEPQMPQRRHEHRVCRPASTTRCGCWRASGRSASSRARTTDRRRRAVARRVGALHPVRAGPLG